MAEDTERKHIFHAEAAALEGELHLPFKQVIDPQSSSKLDPAGGYLSQTAGEFRAERVIHYRAASTQVSGHVELKAGKGWATLATAVVEGLNILEILTADRIVGQIYTVHPQDGHVPRVSFLGTRFENLRIAGHEVTLEYDFNVLGEKPDRDASYTRHSKLLDRIGARAERLCGYDLLPLAARDRYKQVVTTSTEPDKAGRPQLTETIETSLVTKIAGNFPGRAFGHVIHVPDFGDIYLATVKVIETEFNEHGIPEATTVELKMIEAKLGCIGSGSANVAPLKTNGPKSGPPGSGSS